MERGSIQAHNLSKRFRIPQREQLTLKGRLLHPFSGSSMLEFDALQNVSFNVAPGEFFGIIGRNGSGKSTLLKMIAGIYRPDSGSATVNGSIASFIELGVGFNMELTGRDNLFINGALLGLTRKEIKYRYDAIVDFAELHDFMDMKLRNYSSGMQVRLAFSVALQADADVLLTDEVLAVGDARFQEKCYDVFQERKKRGRTIVFVSHDMSAIQQFCDRVMLMERGEEVDTGPAPLMARRYLQLNAIGSGSGARSTEDEAGIEAGDDGAVRIVGAWCAGIDGERTNFVQFRDRVRVNVQVEALRAQSAPAVSFAVRDTFGQVLFTGSTEGCGTTIGALEDGEQAVVGFEFVNELADGQYTLDCHVSTLLESGVTGPLLDNKRAIWSFETHDGIAGEGIFAPRLTAGVARLSAPETDSPSSTAPATYVLASAPHPDGGLFAVDLATGDVETLDVQATTGLDMLNGTLFRVLQPQRGNIGAELVEYTKTGPARITQFPSAINALDIDVTVDGLQLAAAGSNEVIELDSFSGQQCHVPAPGIGEAWRITSAVRDNDQRFVTAFGQYDGHLDWVDHVEEAQGVVAELPSGVTRLEGLRFPHSLTRYQDGWLVANSGAGELLDLDADFQIRRRLDLSGWVCGIAIEGSAAIVSVGEQRLPPTAPTAPAKLAVVDLEAWTEIRRIQMPVADIFALTIASAQVVAMLRGGPGTTRLRERLEAVDPSIDGEGRHLLEGEMLTELTARLDDVDWRQPTQMVQCTVVNLGGNTLATALPHPVLMGYRWTDQDGTKIGEGRQALPDTIAPGDVLTFPVRVDRPMDVAAATLSFSLVLENVAWFSDVQPTSGLTKRIELPPTS